MSFFLWRRAEALAKSGDDQGAVDDYSRILQAPDLDGLVAVLNKQQGAIIDQRPAEVLVLTHRAALYTRLGDKKSAANDVAAAQRILEQMPHNRQAQ